MPISHDRTGRTKRRRNKIDGQFGARLIELLESPAMRVLSLSARRFLDRLEIELGHHAGCDNGALPVTFDDLVRFGMDRHAISGAIRETCALGLVVVEVQGRAGNAEHRYPSLYRLTFKHTDHAEPTHDWRKVKTMQDAKRIARDARKARPEKQKASGGKRIVSVGRTHTENDQRPVGKTPTTGSVGRTPITSISGAGADHTLVEEAETVS